MSTQKKFFDIFMPYCIEQDGDSDYFFVLNHEYNPVGLCTDATAKRNLHYDKRVKIKGLTKAVLAKISTEQEPYKKSFYLYKNNPEHPCLSKQAMDAYLKRLETLIKLVVEWEPKEQCPS